MPSVAQTVSTLSDVLRLVQELFSRMGDSTTIMIGAQYLNEFGPGAPPRVLFVPDVDGELGAALKLNAGYVASWTHGCRVFVRGAEPGDDAGRLGPAVALAARVMTALKALDPGHITLYPGGPKDDSPLQVDAHGADIVFAFTYAANIAQDPAVLRAAAQLTSTSPPNPDKPGGDSGKTISVSVSASPDRS